MNTAINAFPSACFYDGRLQTVRGSETTQLRFDTLPSDYAEVLDPALPDIFAAVPHTSQQIRAPQEAEVAAGVAAEAVRCGLSPHEIAIIAPYRAQGRLIRARLAELMGAQAQGIVVDTVERMQGQERDMVIISLTTSDPAHATRLADFYFQPNRLNVAITRPRAKRIVIGSPALFEAAPADQRHREWVEIFRRFRAQAHNVDIYL
jgi:DNA replication ATP-dependent helicase Dna2